MKAPLPFARSEAWSPMKQWQLLMVPLVTLLLLAPGAAAAARSETRTYEAALIFLSISNIEDPIGVTSDGFMDLGGVAFATQLTDTSVTVTADDTVKAVIDPTNRGRMAIEVCQDIDGDSQCDISALFCGRGTIALGVDPLGFQPGIEIVVFVYATELNSALISIKACAGAPQRAYQGTITASFA